MNTIQKALAALAFISLLPASAMAVGIGFYGEFSRGSEWYGGKLGGDLSGSNDYSGGNGGIIIDTAAAKDRIFNYRFRLGAGKVTLGSSTFTDIGMVHTFGVSPASLRGDTVRFWFGPRIGIHYLWAKIFMEQDPGPLYAMAFIDPFFTPMFLPMLLSTSSGGTVKLHIARLDMGLVFAGFNFNFGDYFTLSIELGFDYGFRVGETKSEELTGDAFGEGIEGFGVLAVMFRISDTYAASNNPEKMTIKIE